jgi:SPP1 family predicted phage head-tail adaptor
MRRQNKNEEIGKMDRRIQLQNYTETTNTYGERLEVYTALATVWAFVDYTGTEGREMERAGRETVQSYANFTIRRRTDITERTRIVFDLKAYDIEGIEVSQDKQFQTLRCAMIGTGSFI